MALTKISSGLISDDAISTASLADGIIQAAHLHASHGITTANIAEGSNQYHTTARARAGISVTDAGGDGSLAYNNSTGVITYTGPSAAEVRAHLSAGTGVTYSGGAISIGQSVATSATPTFGNTTLTGYLRGPSSFTIDPATHGDNTGTVVIAGNLQVDGTTTTINSTTVAIDDLNFSIATDAADSSAANGAGITIGGASATMLYTHASTSFDFNKPIKSASYIEAAGNISTGANGGRLRAGGSNEMQLYFTGSHGILSSSTGNFTVDSAGDIILDAGGQNWYFDDDGTRVFSIAQVSSDVYIGTEVADKDMIFRVNDSDGGGAITALTLDASEAGKAIFTAGATFGNTVQPSSVNGIDLGANGAEFRTLYLDTSLIASNALSIATGTHLTLDAAGEIILDADGGNVVFKDGGTSYVQIQNGSGSQSVFQGMAVDQDMIFKVNDNGSYVNALTLDASVGGQLLAAPLGITIPSYSFAGDSNTGMTRPTGDTLQLVTAGEERVRITSAGLVGMGENTPDTALHIKQTNNSTGDMWTGTGPGNVPSITIQNAGTSDNNHAAVYFKDNDGHRAAISARFENHSTNKTHLGFSTTDSSGNGRQRVKLTSNDQNGADFIGEEGPNAVSSTAGDNWSLVADRAMEVIQDNNNASSWITMKQFRLTNNCRSLSVKFAAKNESGTYYWAWRILRNGSVTKLTSGSDAQNSFAGGLASGESSSVHAFRSFDVDISEAYAGDEITLQMINSTGGGSPVAGTQYLYCKQFEVTTLDYAKAQVDRHGTIRRPLIRGATQSTGYNGNEYTLGHIEIPFWSGSGTHNIIELAEYGQGTVGHAELHFAGLYAYAGRNFGQGITMSSTRRRSSNSDWEDIDGGTVYFTQGANGDITAPDFYWADGVLKVGISSSVQITGYIKVTWAEATIQRHWNA